jgi:hypothetical protein
MVVVQTTRMGSASNFGGSRFEQPARPSNSPAQTAVAAKHRPFIAFSGITR